MPIFALLDANNFYVSCERVFNPALENKPVIVLSNNDSCLISRSNEAKALGLPMGAPYFQFKDMIQKNGVHVFSSNYTLYADLSKRLMNTIQQFCPDMEVYSIDEAFMRLEKFKRIDLFNFTISLRTTIKSWIGLPVSIGIAPTKTLAKIANQIAKKQTTHGVFSLMETKLRDEWLEKIAVEDIWGIGYRLAEKLKKMGIETARALQQANPKVLRKQFGVVMERLILELNGTSCLNLEEMKPKKSIVCSRSFGTPQTALNTIEEALSNYVAKACYKLRQQNSKVQAIIVFLRTSLYQIDKKPYSNSKVCGLVEPTADTATIIQAANYGLKQLFKPGYRYQKVGIMLVDIVPATYHQSDLFLTSTEKLNRKERLMHLVDQINEEQGRDTLFLGAQGIRRTWQMRADLKSNCYTTRWAELAQVRI